MNTERDVIELRDNHAHELRRPTRRASLAAPPRTPGLPVGLLPAVTFVAIPDKSLQTPASTQRAARGRSKKRIIAGAIVGGVGGFFAGGFLGAHIEGDRCNWDDPGVRGFLIGAPIGAVAGGIVGAKFLF